MPFRKPIDLYQVACIIRRAEALPVTIKDQICRNDKRWSISPPTVYKIRKMTTVVAKLCDPCSHDTRQNCRRIRLRKPCPLSAIIIYQGSTQPSFRGRHMTAHRSYISSCGQCVGNRQTCRPRPANVWPLACSQQS